MKLLVTGFMFCFACCLQAAPVLAEQPEDNDEQKLHQIEKKLLSDPNIKELMESIQNDPALAAKAAELIESLKNDPAIAAKAKGISEQKLQKIQNRLQSDPDVTALVHSLQDNPEVLKLLNEPEIMRAINSRDIKALSKDPRILKLVDKEKIKEIIKRARK